MTADIINLRRARKAKARRDDATQAAENRVRFGRSKAERAQRKLKTDLANRRLDGARLDRADDAPPSGNDSVPTPDRDDAER